MPFKQEHHRGSFIAKRDKPEIAIRNTGLSFPVRFPMRRGHFILHVNVTLLLNGKIPLLDRIPAIFKVELETAFTMRCKYNQTDFIKNLVLTGVPGQGHS